MRQTVEVPSWADVAVFTDCLIAGGSPWLQEAARKLSERPALDAERDVETLLHLCRLRARAEHGAHD